MKRSAPFSLVLLAALGLACGAGQQTEATASALSHPTSSSS